MEAIDKMLFNVTRIPLAYISGLSSEFVVNSCKQRESRTDGGCVMKLVELVAKFML